MKEERLGGRSAQHYKYVEGTTMTVNVSGSIFFLLRDSPQLVPLRCNLVLSAHVKVFCPSADTVCQPKLCLHARRLRRVPNSTLFTHAGHGEPRGSAAPEGKRRQRRGHGLCRGQTAGAAVQPGGGRRGAPHRVGVRSRWGRGRAGGAARG